MLPVRQIVHAMKNPHGHGFAADGADPVSGFRFFGVKPDLAFAMPVQVVFPFFRKEFNGA